jgi:hypothetical protein
MSSMSTQLCPTFFQKSMTSCSFKARQCPGDSFFVIRNRRVQPKEDENSLREANVASTDTEFRRHKSIFKSQSRLQSLERWDLEYPPSRKLPYPKVIDLGTLHEPAGGRFGLRQVSRTARVCLRHGRLLSLRNQSTRRKLTRKGRARDEVMI